jgi:hypothetical protein
VLALALALTTSSACGGGPGGDPSSPSDAASTTATVADAGLEAVAIRAEDLPPGFRPSTAVDDTITAFCANEDASAGLSATAREVRGFEQEGRGVSVIQLAFRFNDDDAARFVAQADAVLTRCSGVPDVTGLAFDYDPLSPTLARFTEGATDSSTGRHGINIGSGTLGIDVVVLQQGDIGQLVAVLGVDLSRETLAAIALAAISAAVATP